MEEPPSRSRAVFHPFSSLHYLILWAFSDHSYHHHLRSTFHFCTRSTFPLVGCFALARADSITTPIFSSVPDTFTYYKTIPFTPLYSMVSPRPSHKHCLVPFAPFGRCPCSVNRYYDPPLGVIPDFTCIMLVPTKYSKYSNTPQYRRQDNYILKGAHCHRGQYPISDTRPPFSPSAAFLQKGSDQEGRGQFTENS